MAETEKVDKNTKKSVLDEATKKFGLLKM